MRTLYDVNGFICLDSTSSHVVLQVVLALSSLQIYVRL